MFQKINKKYKTSISEQILFDKEKDFFNEHDSEILIKIGPITQGEIDENI
jgi:hypothetical protein